ncbi:MAG: energy-coupling factor transport system ATP-binding protein [Gaiellaceae bacterium]|nr:energy-coupling factor transport system ATP-binding protein [Gaiellaceae bacterium]
MALARADELTFTYPEADAPALRDVSIEIAPGEVVAVLGPSGSGKSTLLRAFAGLVPHFHGGRFQGRVEIAGRDTRTVRPADLAGTVASVFQDPEEQIVLSRVIREVAFGLENVGTPPEDILERAREALAAVGSAHLAERAVAELSGGELQRVCLASAVALRPKLLLLDEPTSQLDPRAADAFMDHVVALGIAVLVSDHRPRRVLERADRVLFMEEGRIIVNADVPTAEHWLAENRPLWLGSPGTGQVAHTGEAVSRLRQVQFSYRAGVPLLGGVDLELRRGEIVALAGANGTGKTTIAKLAAGLLTPDAGTAELHGRAGMLLQDPSRYCIRERTDEEVAVGVHGDRSRARPVLAALGLAGLEGRHPRDLSSGERERLALASVLVIEPDLLVLDEPTRGVDPQRKAELAALLRTGAGRRATLVVTHDEDFAREVADRSIVLGEEAVLA